MVDRFQADPRGRKGPLARITPARRDRLFDLLRAGNYVTVAAQAIGISPSAIYLYRTKGRQILQNYGGDIAILESIIDDSRSPGARRRHERDLYYAEFALEFERAIADAEIDAVQAIRNGFSDWRAAIAYLERRYPSRWGRNLPVDAAGKSFEKMEISKPAADKMYEFFDAVYADRAAKKQAAEQETAAVGGEEDSAGHPF
jgi:hypothetical protein